MLQISQPQAAAPQEAHETGGRQRFREMPFAFVAILWLGVLLGVSFLATPVKFQAPSLDLPTALEVGRVTFALLLKVEWGFCLLLLAAALLSSQSRALRIGASLALAVVLAAQALWLLPELDSRVSQIVAGATVPASSHHLLYIAAESLKALTLLGLSIEALWTLASRKAA